MLAPDPFSIFGGFSAYLKTSFCVIAVVDVLGGAAGRCSLDPTRP